jgi:hypothetical protein
MKQQDMEIHNLFFSPNTVKAIISKGAECVSSTLGTNAHKVLVRTSHDRSSQRRENNCKDVNWPMKFGVQFGMFYL